MPGSYPKPAGNPVVEIRNFDARVFCGEIGHEVWGYIEYEQALFPGQAQSYELILAPGQEKRGVVRPGGTLQDRRRQTAVLRHK